MRASVMLLGLMVSGVCWPEQEAPETSETADLVPSMELLEFLGTFQDRDGRWFDPLLLDSSDEGTGDGGPRPVARQDDDPGEVSADGTQNDEH